MEKLSLEEKRTLHIKEMIKREHITQRVLAETIERDPVNLNRDLSHNAVSLKTCEKIKKAYPKYNIKWLEGYDDYMTDAERIVNTLRKKMNKADAKVEIFQDFFYAFDYEYSSPAVTADTSPEEIDEFFQKACTVTKNGKTKTFTMEEWMNFQDEVFDFINVRLSHIMK